MASSQVSNVLNAAWWEIFVLWIFLFSFLISVFTIRSCWLHRNQEPLHSFKRISPCYVYRHSEWQELLHLDQGGPLRTSKWRKHLFGFELETSELESFGFMRIPPRRCFSVWWWLQQRACMFWKPSSSTPAKNKMFGSVLFVIKWQLIRFNQ